MKGKAALHQQLVLEFLEPGCVYRKVLEDDKQGRRKIAGALSLAGREKRVAPICTRVQGTCTSEHLCKALHIQCPFPATMCCLRAEGPRYVCHGTKALSLCVSWEQGAIFICPARWHKAPSLFVPWEAGIIFVVVIGTRAVARFLFLSFTFQTNLLVWEDDKARTIKFKNAQEGFMKKVCLGCYIVTSDPELINCVPCTGESIA
eukprot:1159149-Pelagomonas_calceolata.AAC.1